MPKIPDKPDKPIANSNKKIPAVENNELFDVFTSSRCKVCQSKWRVNVDMMLIRGLVFVRLLSPYKAQAKISVIVLFRDIKSLTLT